MGTIRELGEEEWALLRELRLRALGDSPDSFSPLVEEVAAEPEDYWRRGAAAMAQNPGGILVAELDGRAVGLVSATAVGEAGFIGAMWLDPTARGHGLGRALLDAACERLAAAGCARIELSVTETNVAARALYESAGFALNGQHEPLRPGSPLRNLKMSRALAS